MGALLKALDGAGKRAPKAVPGLTFCMKAHSMLESGPTDMARPQSPFGGFDGRCGATAVVAAAQRTEYWARTMFKPIVMEPTLLM